MVIKLYTSWIRVPSQNLLPRMEKSNTRGHSFKVREAKFTGDIQGKFILIEACERLDHVLREVVEADAI